MKNLIILFFVFSGFFAAAQTTRTVYLKNGSVLHGTVTYSKDSSTISVLIVGNNVLVFNVKEVDRLEKSSLLSENSTDVSKAQGYSNLNEIGFNVGDEITSMVHTVQGYRFMGRYFAGIGTGIDFYDIKSIPVFADVRADLFKNRSTPFMFLNAGIACPWIPKQNNNMYYYEQVTGEKPGPYYAGGFGMKFISRSGNNFTFSAAYTQTNFKYVMRYFYSSSSDGETIHEMYQRISLKFGVGF